MTVLGRLLAGLAAALWLCSGAQVLADTRQEIMAAYASFADAQNARDLDRVKAAFVDGPDFLWVSDGQSFWGRDDVITRMGSFQTAEHWKVVPGLDQARVIELKPGVAILHMPLVLEIGKEAAPDKLGFLVSIVFREGAEGWLIAALLTTREK